MRACLLLLLGCGRSFTPSGPADATPFDSGVDALDRVDARVLDAGVDAPEIDCTPWEYLGCSHSEDQWYWNGAACEQIFECADSGFATRDECLNAYRGCEPLDCGVRLQLGSNEVRTEHVEHALEAADACRVGPGERWLARGWFTATESGRYAISSWPYIAWPEPTDLAVLRGGCGDRLLACGRDSNAEVYVEAGNTITIVAKTGYDDEPAEFFFAMDISIRRID